MREIKFRQFINGKFHYWGNKNQDCFIGPVTPVIESQQFTGLLDRNGKEIYEGDILKWKCSTTYTKDKVKLRIVTIQWGHWPTSHGYDLTIYENGNKYATGKSYWNDEDREVIGNIYENPEFVAGTQKGLDLEG